MDYSLPGFPSMGFSRQEYRSGLPLPGGGFSICKTAQRYCYVYCLRGNQDPAPRLHYCSLIIPPLSLHPLPSLINSCLNLPIGTQGRSWRLNEAYFLYSKNWGTQKSFCAQEPKRALLGVSSDASFLLQFSRNAKFRFGAWIGSETHISTTVKYAIAMIPIINYDMLYLLMFLLFFYRWLSHFI